MRYLFFIIIQFSFHFVFSQFDFFWGRHILSTVRTELDNIAIDSKQNIHITGCFYKDVFFNIGQETVKLESRGDYDTYIASYNSNGECFNVLQFGGNNRDFANTLVDHSDNFLVWGNFTDTIDLDPSPDSYTLSGAIGRNYLCRLDNSGNFLWARNVPSFATVVVDNENNIFIGGTFSTTTNFDEGVSNASLAPIFNSAAFISKFDANGNFLWAKKFADGSNPYVAMLNILSTGEIYATGNFTNTGDFDPGPAIKNLTPASNKTDVFISKFSSNGELIWAKSFGGPKPDDPLNAITDDNNNLIVTGIFKDTVDFDPDGGVSNLYGSSTFIAKYDPDGKIKWAKKLAEGTVFPFTMLRSKQIVIVTGEFYEYNMDFDPGPAVFPLNFTNGGTFITCINDSGDFIYATNVLNCCSTDIYALVKDANNNIYAGGRFESTIDVDFGAGTYLLTNNGEHEHGFLIKFSDETLFVNEPDKQAQALIYPNPFSNYLCLKNFSSAQYISITDLYGRVLIEEYGNSGKSNLNTSGLPGGAYILDAFDGKNHFRLKLIKCD